MVTEEEAHQGADAFIRLVNEFRVALDDLRMFFHMKSEFATHDNDEKTRRAEKYLATDAKILGNRVQKQAEKLLKKVLVLVFANNPSDEPDFCDTFLCQRLDETQTIVALAGKGSLSPTVAAGELTKEVPDFLEACQVFANKVRLATYKKTGYGMSELENSGPARRNGGGQIFYSRSVVESPSGRWRRFNRSAAGIRTLSTSDEAFKASTEVEDGIGRISYLAQVALSERLRIVVTAPNGESVCSLPVQASCMCIAQDRADPSLNIGRDCAPWTIGDLRKAVTEELAAQADVGQFPLCL